MFYCFAILEDHETESGVIQTDQDSNQNKSAAQLTARLV